MILVLLVVRVCNVGVLSFAERYFGLFVCRLNEIEFVNLKLLFFFIDKRCPALGFSPVS